MSIKDSLFGDYYLNNKNKLFKVDEIEFEDAEISEPVIDIENLEIEVDIDSIPKQFQEFVISNTYDVFNIFSNIIPNTLSYYVKKARIIDEDVFTPVICREADCDYFQSTSLKLTQSPIDYISETLSIEKDDFIQELGDSMRNYNSFFSTLLDLDTTSILRVIEQYTLNNSKVHQKEWFSINEDNKARYTCLLLSMNGASTKFIRKATGLHHSTVDKIYSKCTGLNTDDIKVSNSKFTKASKPVVIRKLMSHVRNNKQVMLMVAFYNLCARLIIKKNGVKDFLSNYAMPEKISTILATGAYSAVILLNEFLNQYFEDQSLFSKKFENSVPTFDDFMIVLEHLNTNEAEVMRCPKCNTPYLYINDNIDGGEIVYEFRDPQPCPSCGHIHNKLENLQLAKEKDFSLKTSFKLNS